MTNTIKEIRQIFANKLAKQEIEENGTLEILGASFIANQSVIFGKVDEDYVARELEWYKSKSLFVKDIPGDTPIIWKNISSKEGQINSNYGYLFFSEANYNQFTMVVKELLKDKNSRKASAIYTNPAMHSQSTRDGMSDFVCTQAVNFYIRDNKLNLVVSMRSNDSVYGYKNDLCWQKYCQLKVLNELIEKYPLLEVGTIIWQASSLHVYPKHFYLVDNYNKTGYVNVNKADYIGKY